MKAAMLSRILLLAILTSASGCATHALWSDAKLDAFNEPADNPHLSLYAAESRNDFLVVYDEISGRNETIQRRAYWLQENQQRTEKRQAPMFVDKKLTRGLASVPVFPVANKPAPGDQTGVYAILSTNDPSGFTLFSKDVELNSYLLPVYDDGRGVFARIALTPLTVTADTVLVGGYMYLKSAAEGGSANPFH